MANDLEKVETEEQEPLTMEQALQDIMDYAVANDVTPEVVVEVFGIGLQYVELQAKTQNLLYVDTDEQG